MLACTSYGSNNVRIADNMKSNKLCSCQVPDYLFKKLKKYSIVMYVVISYMYNMSSCRQCRRIIYCIMTIKVEY